MSCDSYIICTSPRSGSTLLCRMLRQTQSAGCPESHFHEPSLESWLSDHDLKRSSAQSERELLQLVFQAAIAKGNRDTGIFGLRLQRHSFQFFSKKLRVLYPSLQNDKERISAAFGDTAFIYLTRTDKVRQAISYVKAQQSGLWHKSSDGTELERLAPPGVMSYDADALKRQVDHFADDDKQWNHWFAREDIAPLRLTYEAISENPLVALHAVLDFLGVEREAARGVKPDTAKLSDCISRDWEARFRRELT